MADKEVARKGGPAPWLRSVGGSPASLILLTGLVCAAVLVLPGSTVLTKSLDELYYLLDGAHRIAWGQVPNRDFHTHLGPLAYYLPALGYFLSGSFGGAMPVATGFLALGLAPILAYLLTSRLRPFLAIATGAFLILVLVAPNKLGEGPTALSFAMFYDRVGWVSVALLALMYLRPVPLRRHQTVLDALCASLLALVAVYTKFTYGLFALAFLLFLLSDPRQRAWVATSIAILAGAALVIEQFWQGSGGHLQDVQRTLAAGGIVRGSPGQIADHVLSNLADYTLLTLLAAIVLSRTRSLRDLLFFAFCGIAGFWLINHNPQRWGILTIHAAIVVAAEILLRRLDADPERHAGPWVNRWGIKLFALVLLLPTIVHCAIALGLHGGAAVTGAGRELALPNMEDVRLANLWTDGDYGGTTWYFGTVEDGVAALAGGTRAPERVFVLGRPNPFSAGLGLEPPRGDMPELRWLATLSEESHLPAADLFAGSEIVLEPLSAGGAGDVGNLYDDYISGAYRLERETEHWRLHRRVPRQLSPAERDPEE